MRDGVQISLFGLRGSLCKPTIKNGKILKIFRLLRKWKMRVSSNHLLLAMLQKRDLLRRRIQFRLNLRPPLKIQLKILFQSLYYLNQANRFRIGEKTSRRLSILQRMCSSLRSLQEWGIRLLKKRIWSRKYSTRSSKKICISDIYQHKTSNLHKEN